MQRITWELPFKDLQYLESLTEELAGIPAIILITGMQDYNGMVDSCNITLKEQASAEEILTLGASIGAHAVAYTLELQEAQQRRAEAFDFVQRLGEAIYGKELNQELETDDVIYLPEVAGSFADEEEAALRTKSQLPLKKEEPIMGTEEDLFEKAETPNDNVQDVDFEEVEEEKETIEEEEQEEEEVVVEETIEEKVTTEEIEEVIEKTPDSPAKALLRKILTNFKKSALAVFAALFLS